MITIPLDALHRLARDVESLRELVSRVLSEAQAPDAPAIPEPVRPLSPREWEVLKLISQGKQNKVIAFELGLSEATVKVHVRNAMKKLGARNRTQLALFALRRAA